jgi:hypothetical protein
MSLHQTSSGLSLILPATVGIVPASPAELSIDLPLRLGIVPKEWHFVTTNRTVVDPFFVIFAFLGITAFTEDYISIHIPLPFWLKRF